MARRKYFTDEEITGICENYKAGTPAKEICEKYRVNGRQIAKIIAENGIPQRRPRKPKEKTKRCPHCRKVIDADSRFCKFCGTDARSEKNILIERIDKARSAVMLMPQASRDELMATLAAVESYIRKE